MPKTKRPAWIGPARKAWEHANRWDGYNTKQWRKASAQFKLLNSICCTPGCGRATYVTDHRTPIAAGIDPWDMANWQPLCKQCNASKTAQDRLHARRAGGPDKGGVY